MNKVRISWDDFHNDCIEVTKKINSDGLEFDTIIALARGGLVPARIMADYLKYDNFFTLGLKLYDGEERTDKVSIYQNLPEDITSKQSGKILIIDDVSDGGTTLWFSFRKLSILYPHMKIITATPYFKPRTEFMPTYYSKSFPDEDWLVFPFERD